ncbi:MAG: sulfite exporter TauE/SafE family protein [Candidatus Brocadiia bacterium]
MINQALITLCGTAAVIGFTHTLIGPDHYLPFIMLGKANKWTLSKTVVITILCGIGHVLSSIVLGAIGVGFGIAVNKLVNIESVRGEIAFYLLTGFGLAYSIWGIRYALRHRQHEHRHAHDQEHQPHDHSHSHLSGHSHLHQGNPTTIWTLFIIFVLGPCEPLIPLVMYPAIMHNWYGVTAVAIVFGIITITTMTSIVWLAYRGIEKVSPARTNWLEKWSHALAGIAIASSGLVIKLFGL